MKSPELTPEERDARTVFCMQLSARIRPRDLEDFFTAVGKVKIRFLKVYLIQNMTIKLKYLYFLR